jgi:CheY-like chemotaxis protein
MGTAELAAGEATGESRDDLLRIRDNAERASRIVRSLLGFARETPPERVAVDLNDVVRNVLRLNLIPPEVRVESDLDETLPLTSADRTQLEQVVLNLLTNAEQAMREAGAPAPLIRVRTAASDRTLLLQVTDNGPGIPPDVMPRIFDPFYTTREFGQGTGLGLALCHGIVAGHGGSIRVESEPGAGATFTIVLPVVAPHGDDDDARAGSSRDAAVRAAAGQGDGNVVATRPGRRILIIDDEDAIRSVLARYLDRRGHTTQQAESAEAALDVVDGSTWDAIVLDVRMPGLSGEGLYRRWREERPDLAERVIFATGDTVTASTGGFLQSTGQPVLEKPYDLAQLAAIIEDGAFGAG